jgi:hypothetical protein
MDEQQGSRYNPGSDDDFHDASDGSVRYSNDDTNCGETAPHNDEESDQGQEGLNSREEEHRLIRAEHSGTHVRAPSGGVDPRYSPPEEEIGRQVFHSSPNGRPCASILDPGTLEQRQSEISQHIVDGDRRRHEPAEEAGEKKESKEAEGQEGISLPLRGRLSLRQPRPDTSQWTNSPLDPRAPAFRPRFGNLETANRRVAPGIDDSVAVSTMLAGIDADVGIGGVGVYSNDKEEECGSVREREPSDEDKRKENDNYGAEKEDASDWEGGDEDRKTEKKGSGDGTRSDAEQKGGGDGERAADEENNSEADAADEDFLIKAQIIEDERLAKKLQAEEYQRVHPGGGHETEREEREEHDHTGDSDTEGNKRGQPVNTACDWGTGGREGEEPHNTLRNRHIGRTHPAWDEFLEPAPRARRSFSNLGPGHNLDSGPTNGPPPTHFHTDRRRGLGNAPETQNEIESGRTNQDSGEQANEEDEGPKAGGYGANQTGRHVDDGRENEHEASEEWRVPTSAHRNTNYYQERRVLGSNPTNTSNVTSANRASRTQNLSPLATSLKKARRPPPAHNNTVAGTALIRQAQLNAAESRRSLPTVSANRHSRRTTLPAELFPATGLNSTECNLRIVARAFVDRAAQEHDEEGNEENSDRQQQDNAQEPENKREDEREGIVGGGAEERRRSDEKQEVEQESIGSGEGDGGTDQSGPKEEGDEYGVSNAVWQNGIPEGAVGAEDAGDGEENGNGGEDDNYEGDQNDGGEDDGFQ